jgi:hypothetical protein
MDVGLSLALAATVIVIPRLSRLGSLFKKSVTIEFEKRINEKVGNPRFPHKSVPRHVTNTCFGCDQNS